MLRYTLYIDFMEVLLSWGRIIHRTRDMAYTINTVFRFMHGYVSGLQFQKNIRKSEKKVLYNLFYRFYGSFGVGVGEENRFKPF